MGRLEHKVAIITDAALVIDGSLASFMNPLGYRPIEGI